MFVSVLMAPMTLSVPELTVIAPVRHASVRLRQTEKLDTINTSLRTQRCANVLTGSSRLGLTVFHATSAVRHVMARLTQAVLAEHRIASSAQINVSVRPAAVPPTRLVEIPVQVAVNVLAQPAHDQPGNSSTRPPSLAWTVPTTAITAKAVQQTAFHDIPHVSWKMVSAAAGKI
jgi:hypothetical protein